MYMLSVNPIQQQLNCSRISHPLVPFFWTKKKNTWTVEDWSVCTSLLIRSTPTQSNSALLLGVPPPN